MTNLTLTIDAEVLKRARIRALEEDTSVNALVREFLESYADERRVREEALERILKSSRESASGSGPEGRTWKREDAYEERMWPHKRRGGEGGE